MHRGLHVQVQLREILLIAFPTAVLLKAEFKQSIAE